jgi:lipoprotein-anchoring transpeptidase ErfK/SrfK
MHRTGLAGLALSLATVAAGAQPISLESDFYRRPAAPARYEVPVQPPAPVRRERVYGQHVHVPAPAQHAQHPVRRESHLGGGFIEFLFGGLDAPRHHQQQVTVPPPAAEPGPIERSYAPSRHASLTPAYRPLPAMDPRFLPTVVPYAGEEKPGTIIIDTDERFLYLVTEGGMARRYGIGVGRPGFAWAGVHKVTAKKEWPDWRPPEQMLKRQPYLPAFMPGGPDNPLGARALYLGSTLYRIHGSNEPWTIGRAVSSGCIRMRNQDVIDLYNRVAVGAKVVVI